MPFDAGTFNQLMFKIVLSDVPLPETIVPDLDPAFSSIISCSMARDLTQRASKATTDFIQALDAWMKTGAAVSVPPAADAATAGLLPINSSVVGAVHSARKPTSTLVPERAVIGRAHRPDVAPGALPKKSNAEAPSRRSESSAF